MVPILNLAKSEKEAFAIVGAVKKVVSLLKLIVMYRNSDGISGIELFKKIEKNILKSILLFTSSINQAK